MRYLLLVTCRKSIALTALPVPHLPSFIPLPPPPTPPLTYAAIVSYKLPTVPRPKRPVPLYPKTDRRNTTGRVTPPQISGLCVNRACRQITPSLRLPLAESWPRFRAASKAGKDIPNERVARVVRGPWETSLHGASRELSAGYCAYVLVLL